MKLFLRDDKLALAFCAVGRALDFGTTWVALHFGGAAEMKPGAAQIIDSLGLSRGLILCEFALTTPVIFLACILAKKNWSFRKPAQSHAAAATKPPPENVLLYIVGVVSFLIGLHNSCYIL
jgi:hypothetical protein